MAFLVIAYPEIAQADFDWIQGYRKAHDARYFNVVEPHFTLVFPIADLPRDAFVAEARRQVEDWPQIPFEIRVATVSHAAAGDIYHEFLVPETGYASLIKLHDRLYAGAFAPYLRLDIHFVPHIGIGNGTDAQAAKARVDKLNEDDRRIPGLIRELSVVEFKDRKITPIERLKLRQA